VADLITHSFEKNYVGYSPEVGQALKSLKEFNYQRIYNNPLIKAETPKIEGLFASMWTRFIRDLEERRLESPIWRDYLSSMDPVYLENTQPGEIVRDFIASMTDAYFLKQSGELFFPQPLPWRFA
jgi:dGTPase